MSVDGVWGSYLNHQFLGYSPLGKLETHGREQAMEGFARTWNLQKCYQQFIEDNEHNLEERTSRSCRRGVRVGVLPAL
jgi:hypothetical protein